MPVGGKVDRGIRDMQAKGLPKGEAIAILKKEGVAHQAGRHLAEGPGPGRHAPARGKPAARVHHKHR